MDGIACCRDHQRCHIGTASATHRGHRLDAQGAAVQAFHQRDQLELASDPDGHSHGNLVGLGTGYRKVGHGKLSRQRFGHQFGVFQTPGVAVPGCLVGQQFSLGAHAVDQFGVGMAQHHRHHA